MPVQSDSDDLFDKFSNFWTVSVGGAVIVIVIWGCMPLVAFNNSVEGKDQFSNYMRKVNEAELQYMGQFGDAYGSITSLFTGFGVVLSFATIFLLVHAQRQQGEDNKILLKTNADRHNELLRLEARGQTNEIIKAILDLRVKWLSDEFRIIETSTRVFLALASVNKDSSSIIGEPVYNMLLGRQNSIPSSVALNKALQEWIKTGSLKLLYDRTFKLLDVFPEITNNPLPVPIQVKAEQLYTSFIRFVQFCHTLIKMIKQDKGILYEYDFIRPHWMLIREFIDGPLGETISGVNPHDYSYNQRCLMEIDEFYKSQPS